MKIGIMNKIIIPHRNIVHVIDQSEILFCQSENCYSTIFLADGRSFVVIKSLTKLEKELAASIFIKVNQSYLLNKHRILHVDKKNRLVHSEYWDPIPFTITIRRLLDLITGNVSNTFP